MLAVHCLTCPHQWQVKQRTVRNCVEEPGGSDRHDYPVELNCHASVPRDIAFEVPRSQSVRARMEGQSDEGENIFNELFEAHLNCFHTGSGVVLENGMRLESRLQLEEERRLNGRAGDTLASLKTSCSSLE
jgi:hypothetical protein